MLSKLSYERLLTCDPRLVGIVEAASAVTPLMVICGHRNEADQNAAVAKGTSKLQWPRSKHNSLPSKAVDLAPWPLNWEGIAGFHILAKAVLAQGEAQGVKLVWGGHWKNFKDYPHFELED